MICSNIYTHTYINKLDVLRAGVGFSTAAYPREREELRSSPLPGTLNRKFTIIVIAFIKCSFKQSACKETDFSEEQCASRDRGLNGPKSSGESLHESEQEHINAGGDVEESPNFKRSENEQCPLRACNPIVPAARAVPRGTRGLPHLGAVGNGNVNN